MIIAATLAVLMRQTPPKTYSLRRVGKNGDKFVLREAQIQSFRGQSARFDGTTTEVVVKFDGKGGYLLQTTRQGSSDALGTIPPETTTRYFNARNELVRHETEMSDAEKLTDLRKIGLIGFHPPTAPVGLLAKWTYESKFTNSGAEFRVEQSYESQALEMIGDRIGMKIAVDARETMGGDSKAKLTYWIDVLDGSVLQVEGKVTKVPVITSTVDATIQLAMRRQ